MLGITRWHLFRLIAATLCVAGLVWLGMEYLIPAPPSRIVIGTSPSGEHYHNLGTRYQGILAAADMKVELRPTNGAKENLGLLNDPESGIQVAFMQGGVSNGTLQPDLMSLGRIDHQIFWLFYTAADKLTDLSQLKGKRIGLGAEGSGDRAVCEKILAVAGITYDNTTLVSVAPENVINNLDAGAIDAVFRNFSPESPVLDALLRGPQYHLMNFAEADALSRIFPYLVRLVLPRGAIDLVQKTPASDTLLIATTNVLLARKDIHPSVVDLLAQTTLRAHSAPGLFQKVGEFPTESDPEYPMSQGARDFYRNGPSFLNRYLPFWMTNYAQRFLAVLVAVIAIVVPVFNYAPKLFLWLIRDRVRRLYRRLRLVDKALLTDPDSRQMQALHAELENIARAANIVPMHSSELFFELRAHIDRTRRHLASVDTHNSVARVA
ncbi:MAG TPA: TAXI family TRAP transporter solute-binding subunit [Pseudolabrys sp.]|nr:TAXI family TRAP transporter solute-binding subunit [Pseudolabrys sp.]